MSKSLKSNLIKSFAAVTLIDKYDLDHNDLILLTSLGTIYGRIFKCDESNTEKTVFNEILNFSEKEYLDENKDLQENDEYIALEDVLLITPRGDRINFSQLNVFYDQVIGVTVGTFNPNINTDQV